MVLRMSFEAVLVVCIGRKVKVADPDSLLLAAFKPRCLTRLGLVTVVPSLAH